MPNPEEVATLIVGGNSFVNWESVRVTHHWTGMFPEFSFSTADIAEVPGAPPPANWQKLQFKPGDDCAIYLGGHLALVGHILLRQTSYDANNKGVMLQGVGRTWYAQRACVVDPKLMNFDGKTVEQVSKALIGYTGVGVKVIGQLDQIPFKQLQIQPGEPIGDFIERIGRPKGLILGSDHLGNFLLIGDHNLPIETALVEGINILRMQATISVEKKYSEYDTSAQTGANNEQNGAQASEQYAKVGGTAKYFSPLLTPGEQPVWTPAEIQRHAMNEQKWHEGTIITAIVEVQGWMVTAKHQLWQAGTNVQVVSPMAMLNQVLKIKTATFTQDRNSGTKTTLELVAPWLLNDRGEYDLALANDPFGPVALDPQKFPPEVIDPSAGNEFPELPPLTLDPNQPTTQSGLDDLLKMSDLLKPPPGEVTQVQPGLGAPPIVMPPGWDFGGL